MDREHRAAGAFLYLQALCANLIVTWTEASEARRYHRECGGALQGSLARSQLRVPLGVALLLSAALPFGDSADLLILRLATATLVILRWGESHLPTAVRGGLLQMLGLGIGVLGLCGLGFWWLEPNARTFGDGLWLAFTTAATVGYGDIVPSVAAAKIFAVFVVLLGFAVLSLVTASIAALWVQTEERRIEQEVLLDLHRELRVIREQLAAMRLAQPSQPARDRTP